MANRSVLPRPVSGCARTFRGSDRGRHRAQAIWRTCQTVFAGPVALLALLGCSEGEPSQASAAQDTNVGTVRAALMGLVAAYSFDEGTGTTIHDLSGHGINGTLAGQT